MLNKSIGLFAAIICAFLFTSVSVQAATMENSKQATIAEPGWTK